MPAHTPQHTDEDEEVQPRLPSSKDHVSKVRQGWFANSWFGQHWRGELPLGQAYWLNGLLGNLIVVMVSGAFSIALSDYQPVMGLIGLITVWSVVFAVWLWQVVGIWRTAGAHVSRGGKAIWAVLAKIMVVIGTLQTANVFVNNGFPQIGEALDIVNGDPRVGTYELRLLNAGTELEFIGGIQIGATKDLKKVLDAAPQIKVIHLNSDGGRIGEARKMRDLIRERQLTTYTSNRCHSACTIAFLGGAQRYINPAAKMGFHVGAFPGVPANDLQSENQRSAQEAVEAGVDRIFAKRAYSTTANDSLWIPSLDELINSKFATGISSGQYALSGFGGRPDREKIQAKLRQIPIYDAIAIASPPHFARLMATYTDGIINGHVESDVLGAMRETQGELVAERIPKVSDAALLEIVGVMIDEMVAINKQDPLACYAFVIPQAGQFIDIRRYFDASLQRRELQASEAVLRSPDGPAPISGKEAEPLVELLFQNIRRKYSQRTIDQVFRMTDGQVSNAEFCSAMIVFMSEAKSIPAPHNVRLLRFIFSNK